MLGVVTEVTLRLLPARPAPCTVVAMFDDLVTAGGAVSAVVATMRPSMCELMDAATIAAVEDWNPSGLDRSAAALLLLRTDEPGASGDAQSAALPASTTTSRSRRSATPATATCTPPSSTRATTPAALERASRAYTALLDLALGLGGTVTGEHGIGLAKRSHLERQVGAVHLDVQRLIKAALDPLDLLNPGTSLS